MIPVLLQGADLTPGFLFLNTWIDLRHGLDGLFTAEALNTFERAIKATEPVRYADDSAARMTERAEICPYRGLQIFSRGRRRLFRWAQGLCRTVVRFYSWQKPSSRRWILRQRQVFRGSTRSAYRVAWRSFLAFCSARQLELESVKAYHVRA